MLSTRSLLVTLYSESSHALLNLWLTHIIAMNAAITLSKASLPPFQPRNKTLSRHVPRFSWEIFIPEACESPVHAYQSRPFQRRLEEPSIHMSFSSTVTMTIFQWSNWMRINCLFFACNIRHLHCRSATTAVFGHSTRIGKQNSGYTLHSQPAQVNHI
jgi:hypothetical protein